MKKATIWLLAIFVIAVMAFSGIGCKAATTETTAAATTAAATTAAATTAAAETTAAATEAVGPKQPADMKIGFANLFDGIDFCAWVKQSMIKYADENGVGELITVDNKADGALSTQNIDTLIAANVDGIIQYMNDAAVNVNIQEMCKTAGIPIIAIDIPVGDAPYCGGDNYKAGSICGTELGKAAKAKWGGEIDLYISVETMSNLQTNTLRNGGIIDGIRTQIDLPDEKIVRVDGKDKLELSQSLVTDVLTAHPDAKRILIGCHQDDETGGAFAAVEIAGRQDQVLLGGNGPFASTLANFRLPEANFWIGSTSFVPENYGKYAIPLIIDLIQGKTVQNNTFFEHYWLTWENCEEHYPADQFVVK